MRIPRLPALGALFLLLLLLLVPSGTAGAQGRLGIRLDNDGSSGAGRLSIRADYRIDSHSIVEGERYEFTLWGTIFVRESRPHTVEIANLEYLDAARTLPDRIDHFVDGQVYSYHPFTQYAQSIPPASLAKDKTRWGKYWLPLLTYFAPERQLPDRANLAVTSMFHDGHAMNGLMRDVDQAAEVAKLTPGAKLEYWNLPGDTTFVLDARERIVGRVVDYVRFENEETESGATSITKSTEAFLEELQPSGNIEFPARIAYHTRLPRYDSPHFAANVVFENIDTDAVWSNDVLGQVPADAIFLPAERPRPEELPAGDGLATQICRADYYFGIGQAPRGIAELARIERAILGESSPSPYEIAHLARLYTFAERTGESFDLHRGRIVGLRRQQRQGTLPGSVASFELDLVRRITEFAHFRARVGGSRWGGAREAREDEAAGYLEGEMEQLTTPLAIARLAGRASHHYVQAEEPAEARRVLETTAEQVGTDAAAAAWVRVAGLRVDRYLAERARAEAIKAKRRHEAELRDEIRAFEEAGRADEAERARAELAALRSTP